MRRAARTDTNQAQIVAELRKAGCTVQHLHAIGQGTPDLLVGYAGTNYLLEVKDGAKSPSRRKLTPDEEEWHRRWGGQVAVVATSAEALAAVGFSDHTLDIR